MKTILSIVTSSVVSGGAEKNTEHILKGYYNEGYKVILIIWNLNNSNPKSTYWENNYCFDFYYIKNKGFLGLISLVKLLFKISNFPIDITFISNITLASIIGFLRKIKLYKTSFFLVRDPSSPFLRYSSYRLLSYRLRYLAGYSEVDFLLFQTDAIKDAFLENVPFELPYKVVGNPIDLESVIIQSHEFTPNIEGEYIVTCGRLIYEKGFDLLLKAYSQLNTHYKLVIVGDGPLKESLCQLAHELDIHKNVLFTGFVSNPIPYLKHASLCVIASRIEGFPNVLYQMMAVNDRLLMTKCCGNLENIPYVRFIEANSVQSLKAGLEALLTKKTNDPNARGNIMSFLQTKSTNNYIDEILKITN